MLPPQVEPRGDWQVGSGPACGGLEHVLQCSEVQPLPGAPHSESTASPPSQGQRLPQGGRMWPGPTLLVPNTSTKEEGPRGREGCLWELGPLCL